MAVTIKEQAASYPLSAYNYRVLVGNLTMRFTKVEGLRWERKVVTYRDGLSFQDGEQIHSYRVDAFLPLTLHQGVVPKDRALHEWLQRGDSKVLQVLLCQADGSPILSWQAKRAIPVSVTLSTLDASTNDLAIDTLELQASGWSINHLL
jgi:phage tail-like protein